MSDIVVQRTWETFASTCGKLSATGLRETLYTLEPPEGRRIPAGEYRYELRTTYVPALVITLRRLGLSTQTPHILDVPGWDNNGPHGPVEIHPGNTPSQTEGCTLVGMGHGTDVVMESDEAYILLMGSIPTSGTVMYLDIPAVTDIELGM